MKIQQLIYTSVKSSLSDLEKGLVNQSGFRVYSCSQGMEKDDVSEIVKYASYRLPRSSEVKYSDTPCDPSVPELFPKTFRSFVLPSGRAVALQTVYSGYDFTGNPGNFFAHAFIFEDASVDPCEYFESPDFRTYLTEQEADKPIVTYLPELDEVRKKDGLTEEVDAFIAAHTEECAYVYAHAAAALEKTGKKNMCLICQTQHESDMYLLSLKRMLPPSLTDGAGISTYNIFLPSDKQTTVSFHATVAGMNNITEKSIQTHSYCDMIDMSKADFSAAAVSPAFDMPRAKLIEYYDKYKFDSIQKLKTWLKTFDAMEGGIISKLDDLRKVCGDEVYRARATELKNGEDREEISGIYFELVTNMFNNIDAFDDEERDKIIKDYLIGGIESICMGDDCNLENVFKGVKDPKSAAEAVLKYIGSIMDVISINFDTINDKKSLLLLRLLAIIKQTAEVDTWKNMFSDNHENMSIFVEMTVRVVISVGQTPSLNAPVLWTKDEFAEALAYIMSSTEDELIIRLSEKYVCDHSDIDWESFGVITAERDKSPEEQAEDLTTVKYMLSKAGYVPYSGGSYADIKKEVITDITENKNPLLLSRLLGAYYDWATCGGRPQEAQKNAERVRELLCLMRETEPECYDFIIPKLALEIMDTYSHFHEIIINAETMPPSFWDWFLIGYRMAGKDMDIKTVYQRVYLSNKTKLLRVPARSRLRKEFRNIE